MIFVNISGISREVLIDSGPASNLISNDTVTELGLKIELQSCTRRLHAHGGRDVNEVSDRSFGI